MIAAVGRLFTSCLMGILALFKRAMCFLNRKRRTSGSILPTHIQDTKIDIPLPYDVTTTPHTAHSAPPVIEQQTAQVPAVDEGFTEWDNWDKPSPAPQHLPQPTQQWPTAQPISSRPAAPEPAEPEPEPDYFSDLGLAPTIKKQKKVLVKPTVGSYQQQQPYQHERQTNRLAFAPELASPISTELEEWDDSAGGGGAWDDEDITLEAEQALKQSRKVERERRLAEHQQRKHDRDQRKQSKDSGRLATKLS